MEMWTAIQDFKGEAPFKRCWHSAFQFGNELFIFGGSFQNGNDLYIFNDTHSLNLDTLDWTKLECSGTMPGIWAACCTIWSGNNQNPNQKAIVFGGRDDAKAKNEMYVFSPDTKQWELHQASEELWPEPRCAASITSCEKQNYIILFGGASDDGSYMNDLWTLDIGTYKWTRRQCAGAIPEPRGSHAQVVVGDKLFLFGGTDGKYAYNDMHALDLATFTWYKVIVGDENVPSARYGFTMSLVERDLVICGGGKEEEADNIVHLFNIDRLEWHSVRSYGRGPPPSLSGHSGSIFQGNLFVYGGQEGNDYSKILYVLNTRSPTFTHVGKPASPKKKSLAPIQVNHVNITYIQNNGRPLSKGLPPGSNKHLSKVRTGAPEESKPNMKGEKPREGVVMPPIGSRSSSRNSSRASSRSTSPENARMPSILEIPFETSELKPLHTTVAWKDKYEPVKKIGKGGFSALYKVKHKESGKIFAMKKTDLSKQTSDDKKRTLNELKIHRTLEHPFIVPYVEGFIDKGKSVSVIMEFCEGGDLYAYIQAQKKKGLYIEEPQIVGWFLELSLAVAYLHKNNLIHSDLKTANVFLTSDGRIQLGDFGMAGPALTSKEDLKNYKEKKEINGTPHYMSPEMMQFRPPSFKSDTWAMGVILYEMITLDLPFVGSGFNEIMEAVLRKPYPGIPAHFSPDIKSMVQGLLFKKESLRLSVSQMFRMKWLEPYLKKIEPMLSNTNKEPVQ